MLINLFIIVFILLVIHCVWQNKNNNNNNNNNKIIIKAGTLPLNMYQTAVQRGERLEFVPVKNEDNEEQLESVSREEGREGAFASKDLGGDQLSEYDTASSDNETDDDVEDRAFSRRQNKELGFLFAARRTRSGRLVTTSNRAVLYSNFFYNM